MQIFRKPRIVRLILYSVLLAAVLSTPGGRVRTPFPAAHYRQAEVEPGIMLYPPADAAGEKKVRGGIVSHHLLAGSYIAKYFQSIASPEYRRVIVIGPNHGELGVYRAVTSVRDWETPYGLVLTDVDAVGRIVGSGTVHFGDDVLGADHAAEVIMPYIKVYMPDAYVVPVLVSAYTTQSELDSISSTLSEIIDRNTLVIVSSDFSHYLLPDAAARKDEETHALLMSWQKGRLLGLGNDYLDSPPSVYLLIDLMERIGAKDFAVVDRADGSILAGTPHAPTTTYFFITYR